MTLTIVSFVGGLQRVVVDGAAVLEVDVTEALPDVEQRDHPDVSFSLDH